MAALWGEGTSTGRSLVFLGNLVLLKLWAPDPVREPVSKNKMERVISVGILIWKGEIFTVSHA